MATESNKLRDPRKNAPRPDDFTVEVDGVGNFRFNRKFYGAQIRCDAEISRILGPDGSADKTMIGHALLVGNYKSLMVDCPPGWEDIEQMDLTENPNDEGKILEVYFALKEKLHSFRRPARADQAGQAEGAKAVPDDGILGAPQVQPAAD